MKFGAFQIGQCVFQRGHDVGAQPIDINVDIKVAGHLGMQTGQVLGAFGHVSGELAVEFHLIVAIDDAHFVAVDDHHAGPAGLDSLAVDGDRTVMDLDDLAVDADDRVLAVAFDMQCALAIGAAEFHDRTLTTDDKPRLVGVDANAGVRFVVAVHGNGCSGERGNGTASQQKSFHERSLAFQSLAANIALRALRQLFGCLNNSSHE